ncbi:hypothetical protein OH768_27075 [Streptomyces sp. NBC_01622]|uniref:hypothetical protein n=1 Tax=Streptomyces sp. NBC_01622 TaxID=2975903 RepID=UPI003864B162|nr:hypothetical protein OH768_27075 [Streptomyces sp. NBC_01622]
MAVPESTLWFVSKMIARVLDRVLRRVGSERLSERACIVALGVIAALGQAGIATSVTQPVLYAALGTVAGIVIVGVGGGMIAPMRRRMERMLMAAERETSNAKGSLTAYQAGRADAMGNQPARERTDMGTDPRTDPRRDMPGSSDM